MKYIKLFEDYESENMEYLYHGTSYNNAIEIMENGLSEDTYWGSKETAEHYANSFDTPTLIKVPLDEIKDMVEPNYTLIEYWEENQDDDEDDNYQHWMESTQTALDSYNIFDSVILPPTHLSLSEDNIIKLFDNDETY